jgi:hypothetical protein
MAYAVQIANPQLVQKIEWLSKTMNIGKTAVIDRAVALLSAQYAAETTVPLDAKTREFNEIRAIVARMNRIPDLPNINHTNDLEWDENGLPI